MMRVINKAALALCFSLPVVATDLSDGIAAFNQGRYSVALDLLQKAARSGDKQASLYLALTQAASSNCPAALPTLFAESHGTTDLARLAGLAAARCYTTAGSTAKALAIVEDLKTRFPSDPDVLYVAADAEMRAFNDTTFAMFERTASSYRVHELSARIFEIQNRFGDAVSEYKKAIAMNPKAPDLNYRLGRAILLESHSPQALQSASAAFEAELKISPEDSASEYQLGQIAQVQGTTDAARERFERALKLSPSFVAAMVALATLHTHERQYDQAITLLNRAVELQPANEAAHYALLTAYRDAGQMDKAKAEKAVLDRLQKPPDTEFSDFLKKLGARQPAQ